MITLQDVKADGTEYDYMLSLNKLIGKRIADVWGYISDPFGAGPVFKITRLVMADGTEVFVEGEHDFPYIADSKLPNMDDETLQRLYEEDND